MDDKTLVDRFSTLGVNVNGLVVPGRSVERVLARHAFNLVVHNDDETFRVSLVGSATAVRFRGRYILLCTNHQLVGVDPQRVAMLMDDGSFLVTSGGYRSYDTSPDTDAYDIAAFDFTEPVSDHPDLKRRFFDLSQVPPDTLNVNVMALLLAGYPQRQQTYALAENNHIGFARLHVVCTPDGQPSDPALLRLRAVTPLTVDPDGMSGGSAFVIQSLGNELRAYFAGIILRGGQQYFHVLKPGFVVEFLKSVFARPR